MSELNSRQWALYNFLKDRGDEWTTQLEAAAEIYTLSGGKYYGEWNGKETTFHDSRARMIMTFDIRAINESTVIQKIILSTKNGIKIANTKEFEKYIRGEIKAAVRKLYRAKQKAEKGKRDGQMRLVFNSESNTIKAFLDSDADFGKRLREAREQKGLTAKKVVEELKAAGLQIDEPMLSKFENGYCIPTKRTLAKMGEIYGCEPFELVQGYLPAADIITAI